MFWKPADGSGAEEQLTKSEYQPVPASWSPDGKVLAFTEFHPDTGWDIWLLPIGSDRKPRPFLQTASNELMPMFSPDGHWLAYISDETGRTEVFVRPFPGPGGKWQISTEGGKEPVWAPSGRELFYRSGDKMMAVEVTTQTTFTAAKPTLLFQGIDEWRRTELSYRNYDLTPDGQRFLMTKTSGQQAPTTQIHVVLEWFEELKRLAPAGKQ